VTLSDLFSCCFCVLLSDYAHGLGSSQDEAWAHRHLSKEARSDFTAFVLEVAEEHKREVWGLVCLYAICVCIVLSLMSCVCSVSSVHGDSGLGKRKGAQPKVAVR
jgi:hypothetical protein